MIEINGDTPQPPAPELVITRVFDAPRELVFKVWTEPEHFVRWWGPKGFTTPHCAIDLRPGGRIHYCMRSPEGHLIWNGGVFREVVPPERLVSTDYFADEHGNPVSPTRYGLDADFPAEMLVTVTFEDQAGKTRVTLRQTVPPTVAARHGAQQGWNESLDRLAEYLAAA
jgi:uncharacterized protein YndB with AHSA1/START domain